MKAACGLPLAVTQRNDTTAQNTMYRFINQTICYIHRVQLAAGINNALLLKHHAIPPLPNHAEDK
jgi:hypothetical protein